MELSEIPMLDNFPVWSVICPYYGYLDEWFTTFKALNKNKKQDLCKDKHFPSSLEELKETSRDICRYRQKL